VSTSRPQLAKGVCKNFSPGSAAALLGAGSAHPTFQ
jgi:hypothetical protein